MLKPTMHRVEWMDRDPNILVADPTWPLLEGQPQKVFLAVSGAASYQWHGICRRQSYTRNMVQSQ